MSVTDIDVVDDPVTVAPLTPEPARDIFGRINTRTTPLVLSLLAGIVALGIGCYQLSLPNVLGGVLQYDYSYDDGVYSGVSMRLVHGVLPYRDFVFLHPPGIAYVLAPFSALGLLMGSHTTVVLDRCLTVAVVAANPVLAGWLVRRSGRLAVCTASFALALWPLAVAVDRGVELESYLVFFSLLAAVVLFGRGDEASRRRLFVAGALFGIAIVFKIWGVLPAAGALLVWLPRWRRGGQWLALGLVVGVAVPCAPFLVAAPHAFIHQVIIDQVGRQTTVAATSLAQRMLLMSGAFGLSALSVAGSAVIGLFAAFVAVVIVLFAIDHRRCSTLEWYALASAAISFVGMFESAVLFDHYAYFPVAMMAPLLGVCVGRAHRMLARFHRAPASGESGQEGVAPTGRIGRGRRVGPAIAVTAALGLVAFFIQQDTAYARGYLSNASNVSSIANYIPPGACVLFDYPSDVIAAGRFTPSESGCPAVVDPFGMYVAEDGDIPHLTPPAYPINFEYQWFTYLQQANYVVLHTPYSDYIPWTRYTTTWFSDNYRLLVNLPFNATQDIYIYQRTN